MFGWKGKKYKGTILKKLKVGDKLQGKNAKGQTIEKEVMEKNIDETGLIVIETIERVIKEG